MGTCRITRPIVITETISLGIGGSFTSSAFLIDQLKTLTGYTRTTSSVITIIVDQSVNSAFTSALSNSISVNSLGFSEPFSFAGLAGRFMNYTINAVNSATTVEFNMLGTTL